MRRIRFAALPLPGLFTLAFGGLLFVLGVWWGLSAPTVPTESEPEVRLGVVVGQPAPDFTLPRLDGTTTRLSDLGGHPVVLLFWADWCTSCAQAIDHVTKLAQSSEAADLRVLAINIMQPPQVVEEYVRRHNLDATLLIDSTAEVSMVYGASATPTYYFIDRDGIVVGRVIGSGRERSVEGHLMRILKKAPQEETSEDKTSDS